MKQKIQKFDHNDRYTSPRNARKLEAKRLAKLKKKNKKKKLKWFSLFD